MELFRADTISSLSRVQQSVSTIGESGSLKKNLSVLAANAGLAPGAKRRFAEGGPVTYTGPAVVHAGEEVIPAAIVEQARSLMGPAGGRPVESLVKLALDSQPSAFSFSATESLRAQRFAPLDFSAPSALSAVGFISSIASVSTRAIDLFRSEAISSLSRAQSSSIINISKSELFKQILTNSVPRVEIPELGIPIPLREVEPGNAAGSARVVVIENIEVNLTVNVQGSSAAADPHEIMRVLSRNAPDFARMIARQIELRMERE
jgi:hypothetical protein